MSDHDSASPLAGSSAADETDEETDLSHLPPVHQDVVRRLRAKVKRAATLLKRLKAENDRLRQRVNELEDRPVVPDDETIVGLDDDPEVLRDRISTFIEAIDEYLEDRFSPSTEAAPSPSDEAPA